MVPVEPQTVQVRDRMAGPAVFGLATGALILVGALFGPIHAWITIANEFVGRYLHTHLTDLIFLLGLGTAFALIRTDVRTVGVRARRQLLRTLIAVVAVVVGVIVGILGWTGNMPSSTLGILYVYAWPALIVGGIYAWHNRG